MANSRRDRHKVLFLRIPVDLHDAMRELAKQERKNMNALTIEILQEAVDRMRSGDLAIPSKLPASTGKITWEVGVTTAPRYPETLTDTLASIKRAGWQNIRKFDDRNQARGPFLNMRMAIDTLISVYPAADAYLICQDDIELTANLRPHLEQQMADIGWTPETTGTLLSLYCAAPNHSHRSYSQFCKGGSGWHLVGNVPERAYGALAYVFSARLAHEFIKWSAPIKNVRDPADRLVGCFCRDMDVEYLTHSPSFVQHTGEVSSLPNPGGLPDYRNCSKFMAESPE